MTGAEVPAFEGEERGTAPRWRLPRWAWWTCGSGCLVFTIALLVLLVPVILMVRDARDPEKAWPALAEYLPYDQRPTGWKAEGAAMPFIDMAAFVLSPEEGSGEVRVQWFGDGRLVENALDPDAPQNRSQLELVEILEPAPGTISVQGREIPCLRFRAKGPGIPDVAGIPTVRFDATGTARAHVLIEVRAAGESPIPDERVQSLLEPFDVWRGR